MRIINSLIGFAIIVVGFAFMFTTVYNEPFNNIMIKVLGFVIAIAGAYYLKRIGKFGKQ